MPKAASLQSSFNAGELSPLMRGRSESPRYKQGLETCLNYIPTLQGPLVRRPGTKFMTEVKDSTKPPVLIPFQFSLDQSYMLEFGDHYVRFYANNGQLITSGTTYRVDGIKDPVLNFYSSRASIDPGQYETVQSTSTIINGSILEIGSPYAWTDLSGVRYVQNADTLYLFHPNYPPYKLQRSGQQFWQLSLVYLQDGPYLPLNSYRSLGDQVNVTLTPLSPGAPFTIGTIIQTGPSLTVSAMVTDPLGSGQIQVTTSTAHGYGNGQNIFIDGVVGTTEANNYDLSTGSVTYGTHPVSWQISIVDDTNFLLNGSTFAVAYVSGGRVLPALFQNSITAFKNSTVDPDLGRLVALDIAGVRYWGTLAEGQPNGDIYPFRNAASAIVYQTTTQFPASTATAWQLGTYSVGNGFPTCGTFHQDRLCLAGSGNSPQQVDGSTTGEYENFAGSDPATLSVTDNNAFSFGLNSTNINSIKWMTSNAQGLLAGSLSAEWAMTPSSAAEALTPTNFNASQTSYYGSADAEAIQAGNAALYIQRAQRKVREMNFFFQVGTFRSTDLTELSEHITLPTILKIVYQKETQPLIWGVRSDGNVLSMIYDRTDVSLQAGWTRHQLGGKSDFSNTNPIVTSIAVIPSADLTFDQLWMVVKRSINEDTVYYIEYMTKIYDDSILQEDAFQLDCGGTYDLPKTITGITNANPAVVTAVAHGFSNGDSIRISAVNGLGKYTSDINGNVTVSNLVNNTTFVIANKTTDTFQLHDFSGNAVDSTSFGEYVSGGQVRKLVKTISGLTWLEGEEVGVLTDGSWHPDCVVSSGTITLNYPAAKVQIGYRYPSQGKLLRVEAGAADGTSIGKTRRTTRAAFQVHSCGDLYIGTSFDNLIPLSFSQSDQQKADQATPLFSGIIREGIESAYDFESQICFEQVSPLPGAILSITSFMEETDV